jgi:integrase
MLSQRIEAYLEDHKTAWAESTIRSERHRLVSVSTYLDQGPEAVYKWAAENFKPYSVKTLFIRICRLEAWAGGTVYRTWYAKHKNRFKYAYRKEEVNYTFEEVQRRLSLLAEPYRTQAVEMLATGLRISEVPKVKDGIVEGKGAKLRPVFGTISMSVPRSTFWAKLRAVGLKPHTLRKVCATRLAEMGATPADLCKVFGWSSIDTAYQYLQPKDDDRLRSLMKGVVKGL